MEQGHHKAKRVCIDIDAACLDFQRGTPWRRKRLQFRVCFLQANSFSPVVKGEKSFVFFCTVRVSSVFYVKIMCSTWKQC